MLTAIIDDDESVRRALGRLLRAANLESRAFPSGRAFLEEFRELGIGCIVLDLQMPDLTGLELLRQLRALSPDPCLVPAIIITAHDEPGSRERCLAAGASAYLRKPVDSGLLLAEIGKAVAQAGGSLSSPYVQPPVDRP